MTDLEKVELALRRTLSVTKRRPFDTPTQALQCFADELVKIAAVKEATIAEMEMPEAPWRATPTDGNNAKIKGWTSYFEGKGRNECPFPPDRADLKEAYEHGWDTAAVWRRHNPGSVSSVPSVGPVTFADALAIPASHPLVQACVEAAKLFRFYEAEHYNKADAAENDSQSRISSEKARRNGDAAEALEKAVRDWVVG